MDVRRSIYNHVGLRVMQVCVSPPLVRNKSKSREGTDPLFQRKQCGPRPPGSRFFENRKRGTNHLNLKSKKITNQKHLNSRLNDSVYNMLSLLQCKRIRDQGRRNPWPRVASPRTPRALLELTRQEAGTDDPSRRPFSPAGEDRSDEKQFGDTHF